MSLTLIDPNSLVSLLKQDSSLSHLAAHNYRPSGWEVETSCGGAVGNHANLSWMGKLVSSVTDLTEVN